MVEERYFVLTIKMRKITLELELIVIYLKKVDGSLG